MAAGGGGGGGGGDTTAAEGATTARAAQLGEEPWSADVATAYLNAHIKVLICAYKPSFVKFLGLSMKQLLALEEAQSDGAEGIEER